MKVLTKRTRIQEPFLLRKWMGWVRGQTEGDHFRLDFRVSRNLLYHPKTAAKPEKRACSPNQYKRTTKNS